MLNIAARLSGAMLGFLLTVILARSMEPAAFAQVSVALAWLAIATVLGCAGMPLVVMRFIGENIAHARPDLARGVMLYALGASFVVTGLLALVGWVALLAGLPRLAPQALELAELAFALLVPNVLLTVVAAILQGLDHALVAEMLNSMLRALLMLAGIASLWPGPEGPKLDADTVLWLYFWVSAVLLVAGLGLAFHYQRRLAAGTGSRLVSYEPRHWFTAGMGLLTVLVAFAANERIDVIMLGWTGTHDTVAVYAVAQRFAQTVTMAMNALAVVLAPRFVACLPQLRHGHRGPAQAVVRIAGRYTLWTCLAAWACFAVGGPWFTALFGKGYASAYLPLTILVTGQVVAALFGPGLIVATLSGHVSLTLACLAAGIVTNAALNWVSVPHWGANGAAGAAAAGAVVAAAVAQHLVRQRLGLDTLLWRPLALRPARSTP